MHLMGQLVSITYDVHMVQLDRHVLMTSLLLHQWLRLFQHVDVLWFNLADFMAKRGILCTTLQVDVLSATFCLR